MASRIDLSVYSASGREEDRNAGSIYRILYQDRDRARALRVVETLLDTFVTETLSGKREGSENAQQFLEVQIRDYEKRLRTAEDRLAQFKARHIGLMPTEQGATLRNCRRSRRRSVTSRPSSPRRNRAVAR